MATNTDKIDKLFEIAHTLTGRVDAVREDLAGIRADGGKHFDSLAQLITKLALLEQSLGDLKQWKEQAGVSDLKSEVSLLKEQTKKVREDVDKTGSADMKTEIALLKDQVKKLQDTAEKRGNRAWSIVPNLLAAIVNVLLGAAIAYLVARK